MHSACQSQGYTLCIKAPYDWKVKLGDELNRPEDSPQQAVGLALTHSRLQVVWMVSMTYILETHLKL